MAEIIWQLINVKQISGSSGEAFARVGQGMISLSAAACRLLDSMTEVSTQ